MTPAQIMRVTAPSLWVFEAPDPRSRVTTQFLFGEQVTILDTQESWVKAKASRDGYEGWVAKAALAAANDDAAPTHVVTAPSALVYGEPDFHGAPILSLPMNAAVCASQQEDTPPHAFLELQQGGFIPTQQVSADPTARDPVAIAKLFLGTPYGWGGRTRDGIDCSGLVQQSLWACGQDSPRDSGDQWAGLGKALGPNDVPRQGDLVFFPGHVGFYLEGERLLHANATHMRCTIDPLSDVIAWVAREHDSPITGFKRLDFLG